MTAIGAIIIFICKFMSMKVKNSLIYVEDFDTIKLLNEGVVHVLGRGLSTSWRIAWQILKNETHAYFLCMGLFYFKEKGIWYEFIY